MRAILLLVGATQALRPSTPQIRTKTTQALRPTPPPPRTKTALNAFTNPFAQRPEEMKELEPYETAPLFGECRRKLAACIIVGFEDFGGVATNAQAEVEVAAADVRLRALVKKLFDSGITQPSPKAAYGLARLATWTGGGLDSSKWVREPAAGPRR